MPAKRGRKDEGPPLWPPPLWPPPLWPTLHWSPLLWSPLLWPTPLWPALPWPALPMTGQGAPEGWNEALADLLRRGTGDVTPADLHGLAKALQRGPEPADPTRQTILHLLAARQAQSRPTRPGDLSQMPDWPGEVATALPGISLVALCRDDAEAMAALGFWRDLNVDEIVVVILPSDPQAAAVLSSPGLPPNLRIIRLEGEYLSPAQALNLGLRLCRHQRVLVAGAFLRFAPTYLSTPAPPPDEFRVDPGAADGSGFALDVRRRDLALVGGFNEYLDTLDHGTTDLATRLIAKGLRPVPFLSGQITRPPFAAPTTLPDAAGDLGTALRRDPGFAALCNRHLAAVMPDWTATMSRPFDLADSTGPVLTLRPLAPPVPGPTAELRAAAARHALVALMAHHIGGPVRDLDTKGLDLLLATPAAGACALDVAVAGSTRPDLVATRRAWLLVHLDATALALDGPRAKSAFQRVETLATRHGLTLILTLPKSATTAQLPHLSHHPVIACDPALTQGVRALSLRDLCADPELWRLPQSTLDFDARLIADHEALATRGPALLLRRPKIFVDAQHGLGNRLRAIASAGAIATATGRELVIIWQADDHCDCQYDDLFDPGGAVLDQGFHDDPAIGGIDLFNYMEIEPGSAKDQPIRLSSFHDTYIRSAYPLNSPFSNWDSENLWLQGLRPNAVVRDLVASVRNPNALALHIRMEGGTGAEHLAYEAAANWTAAAHQEIDHWRKRSHFGYFQTRLDQLIAKGAADTVFLATDTPAVYDTFREVYGNRVATLPRPFSDRSAPALTYALADMILLSRAPRLLGSTWSSFSELAARLGDRVDVELSGRDF